MNGKDRAPEADKYLKRIMVDDDTVSQRDNSMTASKREIGKVNNST